MSEESQDKEHLAIPEKMFHAQKEAIKRLAQEGPCVFVGRCVDQILKDDNQLKNGKLRYLPEYVSYIRGRVCRTSDETCGIK